MGSRLDEVDEAPTAVDVYLGQVREAWRLIAAIRDGQEVGDHAPYLAALDEVLFWLEMEAECGDCVSGRCHWGGQRSADSIAAARAGHDYTHPQLGRCGCDRHEFSVEVGRRDHARAEATS